MPDNYQIHFAPLQGSTDAIYRNTHARIFGGADAYYTPFVRIEKDTFRNKEIREIAPANNETTLIPQLLAGTPAEFRSIATLFVENGYKQADINLGCPFPLLVRKHKGSGLLPYPEEVAALLRTIEEFPELSFSVKLRLGWEKSSESLALLPLLNTLPLHHITVHARLGIQQYKGDVDKEAFERFYSDCTHPLFYNGDILTIDDIQAVITRFPKLKGVMIGRGLLSHPEIAAQFKAQMPLPADQLRTQLQTFHTDLFESYKAVLQGDHQLLAKLKVIWEYFLPDAEKRLRKKIIKSSRVDQYLDAVHVLLKQYPDVQ